MKTYHKIIFLTSFLAVIINRTFCQPADTTLSQPLTGNHVIEATNSITFAAGFSYNAQSSNQLVANVIPTTGNSNYTFTEPQESGPLQVNTSYPAGSLNSSISVGPTGAANYIIPVDIPPGRNGMKPNLSLIYNSQSGEGLLGLGWALSGLSAISRVPTDIYHEGYIDVVDFDSNDKFTLDGQRLISVGGDQYRTENESFSKITLYGSSTNPTYFKVETKDGLELYYGNTIDSKAKAKGTSKFYAWNINQVKDKNGNYYVVTYIQDTVQCEIFPVNINYSCYGSNPGDYTIEFGYETRSNPILTFINGSAVQFKRLMNLVTIKYNTTVVGKMQLNYSDSKLEEIIKYGKNNTRLNSTFFNWGNTNTGLAELYRPRIRTLTSRFQGDFNGDGKTDLIVFSGNPDTCSLFLADSFGQLQFFSNQILASNYIKSQVYLGDYNGDGQEDLMIFRLINNGYRISYLTFNGTSFITIDDSYQLGFNTDVTFFTGDFNGDKKTDLMMKAPHSSQCVIYSITFQFDGSAGRVIIGNSYINWGTSTVLTKVKDIPLDMNGDGKTEIMAMDQTLTRFYGLEDGTTNIIQICSTPLTDNTKTNLFGDFNGDGMIDIFAVDSYVLLSKGNGFAPSYCPFYNLNPAYNNFYTYDMNGDGKCDIVVVGRWASINNPVKIYVEYSCGYNTNLTDFIFQLQTYNPVSVLQFSPIVNFYDSYNRFGDYNGDGVTDFYYEDGIITRLFNTYRGRSQYFVSEIKNGLGYSNHINYSPITYDTVYYNGTTAFYPVIKYQGPLYVVKSVSIDNPDFTHSTTSYSYYGANFHLQGKGFLGFKKVTSINSSANIKLIDEYEYDPTFYYVSPKRNSIYTLASGPTSDELISDVTYTNSIRHLGSLRYFAFVSSSIENNYLTGVTITKHNDYDSSGNLTSYREDFDDESYNITTYSDFSSAGTWFSAKPQTVTNTRKHYQDSQSFSLTSTYTYYSTTGYVNTKAVGPLISSYQYDIYGNPTVDSISDGSTSRTNKFIYDTKNMFIWKSFNALNHKTERTYDYVTGNVLTEETPDNVLTQFDYDDFGILTGKSTSVLGQSQSVTYGWTTGTRPLGSVYYKQITTSGAPTTKAYYDAFGRVLRTETTGFDGNLVYLSTVYNNKGQVSESSLPYKLSDTPLKKVYIYDKYGRKTSEESTAGIVTFNYTGKTVQVTNSAGQTSSKTSDSQGNLVSGSDDAGSFSYSYKSIGKPCTITSVGSSWSMGYDNLGRQTSLTDPDAGTITYRYNNFNELTKQTDARGKIDSLTYDVLGRVSTEIREEGTKVYKYDPAGHPGLLDSVTYNGGSVKYSYDGASRLTGKATRINGSSFSTGYGYDNSSRLQTITYPSGFTIKNVYNASGYKSEVRRNDNNAPLWQGQNVNAFGQFTQYIYGNNLTTTKTYDCLGMLRHIGSGSVQDMDYSYDYESGNLVSRKDNLRSLIEIFTYDNLKRLTGISGPVPMTLSYYSNGNIQSKTSVGTYSYESLKPHAVTGVTNPDGLISTTTQSVSYTSFNKVDSIIQSNLIYTLAYGDYDKRTVSRFFDNGSLQKTVYYVGEYEKEVKPGNHVRQLHYIAGGDGLAAIFVRNDGADTLYYIHADHLGSINVITNQSGAVVKNYSFDAWGRRRNPVNWTYNNVPSTFLFSRGFTGHEHLDQFTLINMNGRVYDPLIARILSSDNFVQVPDFTQSFNRYSYCYNNPLVYTDPDGELAWFVPIIIGAILYGGGNVAVHASQGDIDNFWEGLGYFAQGAVSGAIVGATWSFGLASLSGTGLLGGGSIIQGMNFASQGFAQYAGWAIMGGKAVNTLSTITSLCNNSENAGKILLGKTYTDENNFWHGLTQSITRYTWEGLQTWAGYNFSQFRNTFGGVDRVDYLGGATFVTGENREYRQGVSLGNYPNIWLWDEIEGNFDERVTSDPIFMHEYGHTFDSQWFGPLYLPVIGIPSASGALWTEKRANRYAKRYFEKHYGVDWTPFLTLYPIK